MHTEYELKFFQNIDYVHTILSVDGKIIQPHTLMKRIYLQDAYMPSRWIRIRDEGNCIKVTYKKNDNRGAIDSVLETEMQISDFKQAQQFFLSLGFIQRLYIETFRETWKYKNAVVTFDTWPGIPPFLEIEGSCAQDVYECAQALGYDIADGVIAHMQEVYVKIWNISSEQFKTITVLTFENIEIVKQDLLEKRT